MKKITWITSLLIIGLISCQTESNDKKAVETLTDDEWNEFTRVIYNEDGTIDSSQLAIFEWVNMEYDFGTVVDGEMVEYNCQFKNVGQAPLIISQAKGSCGCTVPERPEEPIAPGENGKIKVKFNSANRVGNPRKEITLTANTLPRRTKLILKGIVKVGDVAAPKIKNQ